MEDPGRSCRITIRQQFHTHNNLKPLDPLSGLKQLTDALNQPLFFFCLNMELYYLYIKLVCTLVIRRHHVHPSTDKFSVEIYII